MFFCFGCVVDEEECLLKFPALCFKTQILERKKKKLKPCKSLSIPWLISAWKTRRRTQKKTSSDVMSSNTASEAVGLHWAGEGYIFEPKKKIIIYLLLSKIHLGRVARPVVLQASEGRVLSVCLVQFCHKLSHLSQLEEEKKMRWTENG